MTKATGIAWVLGILCCGLAWADERGAAERELDAARERAKMLLREAEELQEAGRREEAQEHVAEANRLYERIAKFEARKKKKGEKKRRKSKEGRGKYEKILHGLEMGIEALKKLGDKEGAQHLKRRVNEVREEMRARERREREHRENDRRHAERGGHDRKQDREHAEHLERRTEVMRLAMAALQEANKRDAAELMEHAIHALELRAEGRRDEKAAKIMESSPKLGNQIELLMLAGRLYREWKHPDRAEMCEKMARHLREIYRREREHGPRERDVKRSRGREGGESAERIARLEDRFRKVANLLERLQVEMREMRKQMERR